MLPKSASQCTSLVVLLSEEYHFIHFVKELALSIVLYPSVQRKVVRKPLGLIEPLGQRTVRRSTSGARSEEQGRSESVTDSEYMSSSEDYDSETESV